MVAIIGALIAFVGVLIITGFKHYHWKNNKNKFSPDKIEVYKQLFESMIVENEPLDSMKWDSFIEKESMWGEEDDEELESWRRVYENAKECFKKNYIFISKKDEKLISTLIRDIYDVHYCLIKKRAYAIHLPGFMELLEDNLGEEKCKEQRESYIEWDCKFVTARDEYILKMQELKGIYQKMIDV